MHITYRKKNATINTRKSHITNAHDPNAQWKFQWKITNNTKLKLQSRNVWISSIESIAVCKWNNFGDLLSAQSYQLEYSNSDQSNQIYKYLPNQLPFINRAKYRCQSNERVTVTRQLACECASLFWIRYLCLVSISLQIESYHNRTVARAYI